MMKHNKVSHKFIAILLAAMLVLGTVSMAFAADDNVPTTGIIYQGQSAVERWLYKDIDTSYTSTDLFCNFKDVMPGDILNQPFIVKNNCSNQIKLFMEVLPHDANNALSDGVAEHTTTPKAIDFLNQLSLEVTADNGGTEKVLFHIPQGKLGAYYGKQELGLLSAGYAAALNVKLNVPIELDNPYADKIGEVDFRFTIEEITSGGSTPEKDPEDDPDKDPDDPSKPDEPIVIPGEPVEDVEDPKKPIDAPKTGDTADILTPILLMVIAVLGLITVQRWRKSEQ